MISPVNMLRQDGLAIYLFHGVVEKSEYSVRNYTKKHLEKNIFAAVIRELCEHGQCLSIEDVVECRLNGQKYPPNAFVISFDDGFENNYSIAAPILAEEGVPAVFYVTTKFIEHNGMSWIDRIEYCLEKAASGRLSFKWDVETRLFQNSEDKIKLLEEIRLNVKKDSTIDVVAFANDIFDQCDMEPVSQSNDPLDQKMSWEQVRALNESPGFTVGGHTHTHATMSFLSPENLNEEISISLRLLREKAGVMPRHFSYPEGLEHCYSPQVIATLKRHGIVCCPTAIEGVNSPEEDLFHLKRIMVA